MTRLDRSPARLSSGFAVVMGLIVATASAPYAAHAAALSVAGLAVLTVGVVVGRHRLVTLGCAGLFVSALAAGAESAPVLVTLISVTGAVLAWDFAGTAIDLGEQLGRSTRTARLEVVHAAGSTAVGAGVGGLGFLVYLSVSDGQPISAVFALLVAAVLLLVGLRHLDPATT